MQSVLHHQTLSRTETYHQISGDLYLVTVPVSEPYVVTTRPRKS
jgi:hypothetical protein